MTKIKHIKGQFDEVVFKRDGQEHTVFIIEGLVYTKTRELFTGEITGKHNAKVIEGKFEGKVSSYFSDEELQSVRVFRVSKNQKINLFSLHFFTLKNRHEKYGQISILNYNSISEKRIYIGRTFSGGCDTGECWQQLGLFRTVVI